VIALTQVFEPYLVLSALVALPVALIGLWRPAIYVGAILVAAVLIRYEAAWLSTPAVASGGELNVAAWNVLAGPQASQRTLEGLIDLESTDMVGLVELQPAMVEALRQPTLLARFPHQALAPEGSVYGVGLISRYPILEQSSSHDPPFMRALVDTPATTGPTVVYVVHPLPARIRSLGPVPVALDTARRDAALAQIRAAIDADLAQGRSVIVLGDINTTEREPAYADFASGLRDAHLDAGFGPGFTWRPPALAGLPFGLLRIDYVFSSPSFRVVATSVTCHDASDHCLITAALQPAGP
jgi:vancomycin resistance protein VanJ